MIIPDFKCEITEDCQGHGICDGSGKCICNDNWNSKADCSGMFQIVFSLINLKYLVSKNVLQSFCVETMVIVTAMGLVWTPNVIVYLDGIHFLIAMVSTYSIEIYSRPQAEQS